MKAQFWSIDMVFALVIFTVAIAILSIIWSSVLTQYSVTYGGGAGTIQIQLDNLVQDLQLPGYPANWNTGMSANSVSTWPTATIGLGSGTPGQLSVGKVMTLMAMSNYDYQATKQAIGVGYDYYIVISAPSELNLSIGRDPFDGNATSIQSETVPVVLSSGQTATMEVMVWTNTTFGVG